MEKSKLILLGIDGMDFEYTQSILDKLPNLKKLAERGAFHPLRSVFPPDSIPAWITCYTGEDPSEHGVLESINYLAKGADRLNIDTSSFQGKTFWDIIGKNDLRVCVINPFMAYPVWKVNGVMVNGPVFIDGEIQQSNIDWLDGITIPKSLGGIVDFPTRKTMSEFVEKIFTDTREQMDFGISMLGKNRPDLFFQTFLTMDRLQHFLWRYCDPSDPTHPGENNLQDSIERFYILIDSLVGEYTQLLDVDDHLMVISDHGHGMRCTHCFNINEELRMRGYVQSIADGKFFSRQLLVEKLKNSVLNFLNEHNLEDYISVIAKLIPNAGKLKKGKYITKECNNIAYASDFTGTNPFGGICINRDKVSDYEQFRRQLMDELATIEIDGGPVFLWLKKREEMFAGKHINRYPDILFSLQPAYGVSWNLHTKTITVNPTHKKISGGHKEKGIFFTSLPKKRLLAREDFCMENIFASLLCYYNIKPLSSSMSKSFIES